MISSHVFRPDGSIERDLSPEALRGALAGADNVVWVDLEAPEPGDARAILQKLFAFHPLTVEDCIAEISFPKLDDYGKYLFLVLHAPDLKGFGDDLKTLELDLYLGPNYVVTYHRTPVKSISDTKDLYAAAGVDAPPDSGRFMCQVLSSLARNYGPVVETIDGLVDKLDEDIFHNPGAYLLARLLEVRRDIFELKRIMALERDTILGLAERPGDLIRQETVPYLRDVTDQLTRLRDSLEMHREYVATLRDTYLSVLSNNMNQTMKTLTLIATIMLPLTFIAGIYGMNFEYMPETKWHYGYFGALALMALVAVGMALLFRWKKWS